MTPGRRCLTSTVLVVLCLAFCATVKAKQQARGIQISNSSNRRLEVYWIHPDTKELVLQTNPLIYHGATFSLNSFVGHAFEVRELPASKTGVCGDVDSSNTECRRGYFTVNANNDQVILVHPGIQVEHTDNKSIAKKKAVDVMGECQQQVLRKLDGKDVLTGKESEDAINDLADCVDKRVDLALAEIDNKKNFEANLRGDMANLLEGYTCADQTLNTTEPKEIKTIESVSGGTSYRAQLLFDRKYAMVHYVDHFVTENECKAIADAAKSDLSRDAYDADNLLAHSASVQIPWEKTASPWTQTNPLQNIARKIFDYAKSALQIDIDHQGQQPLQYIRFQAHSQPDTDTETDPDQYKPHCDGPCHGEDLTQGTVFATMIIYCSVADQGAATNFRNAGLHIVPKRRGATFASYLNTESQTMDKDSFSEYSICPVLEGETAIATQLIRYGVNADNPWSNYPN